MLTYAPKKYNTFFTGRRHLPPPVLNPFPGYENIFIVGAIRKSPTQFHTQTPCIDCTGGNLPPARYQLSFHTVPMGNRNTPLHPLSLLYRPYGGGVCNAGRGDDVISSAARSAKSRNLPTIRVSVISSAARSAKSRNLPIAEVRRSFDSLRMNQGMIATGNHEYF